MNRWSNTVFIVTIFLAGLLTHCAGNVIFEKEARRQPSTGSILVEIAKELVDRSKNTNQACLKNNILFTNHNFGALNIFQQFSVIFFQMLNLNLSNLLLLMVLKAVVFGANFIGSNNDEKSRGLDSGKYRKYNFIIYDDLIFFSSTIFPYSYF